jgi:hypothetical protein
MKKQPDLPTERPRFTDVKLYTHPREHLSFWYPPEWHLQEVEASHLTVTLLPDLQDVATHLTVEVKDILSPILETERSIIETGVKEGLAQFNDLVIDSWRELGAEEVGQWGLEWVCRFTDEGQRRKRRARLFFSKHHLYSVICQGGTEARYGYWQGMFEFVLLTVGVKQSSISGWLQSQNQGGHRI